MLQALLRRGMLQTTQSNSTRNHLRRNSQHPALSSINIVTTLSQFGSIKSESSSLRASFSGLYMAVQNRWEAHGCDMQTPRRVNQPNNHIISPKISERLAVEYGKGRRCQFQGLLKGAALQALLRTCKERQRQANTNNK
jgi:hypothetical protein